jgi:hypothetical protein
MYSRRVPVAFTFSVSPGADAGATAMRGWALDPITGDLMHDSTGRRVDVTGAAGIAQDLQCVFKTFLGEWYLDTSKGFPWFQNHLGQRSSAAQFRRDIEKLALTRPGVVAVVDFDMTSDNQARSIAASFKVECDSGLIIDAALTAGG